MDSSTGSSGSSGTTVNGITNATAQGTSSTYNPAAITDSDIQAAVNAAKGISSSSGSGSGTGSTSTTSSPVLTESGAIAETTSTIGTSVTATYSNWGAASHTIDSAELVAASTDTAVVTTSITSNSAFTAASLPTSSELSSI